MEILSGYRELEGRTVRGGGQGAAADVLGRHGRGPRRHRLPRMFSDETWNL